MSDRIRIAFGAIWEEAASFARAEAGLLAPLAMLGFGLPMAVLELLVPPDFGVSGRIDPAPWMFWMIPYGLLSMLGSMSISTLALAPGMSVREALARTFRRMPAAIGTMLIGVAGFFALTVPVSIVAGIELATAGKAGPFSQLAFVAVIGAMIWMAIRLMPLWAVLVDRGEGPWASLRRAFGLTRGHYARLLLLRLLVLVCQLGVMFVVVMPVAAVFGLLGKMTGQEALMQLLSLLVNGAIVSALVTLWTVYVARLYRALAAADGK